MIKITRDFVLLGWWFVVKETYPSQDPFPASMLKYITNKKLFFFSRFCLKDERVVTVMALLSLASLPS